MQPGRILRGVSQHYRRRNVPLSDIALTLAGKLWGYTDINWGHYCLWAPRGDWVSQPPKVEEELRRYLILRNEVGVSAKSTGTLV